jgi:hypothetical protein
MNRVAVHVFRMTDFDGFRPMVHAQNNVVMNDFPARGGIDTDNELISRVSTLWNDSATDLRNGRFEKNS